MTDPRICGRKSTTSRTWVGIHDADSGRRIHGHCAIGGPEGLRTVHFPIRSGGSAPSAIYVSLTDRETRRTVRSSPVKVPQQVTVHYTAAESANIDFAARYWGRPRHNVQQNGVMAIRFIHGVAGTTGSAPLRPRPEVSGPVSYRSWWTSEDRRALDWVSDYYDLTYAETHKLGTAVMVFFAALDQ